MKIIKQELQFEECLKQKLEFICEFAKVTPTFINGSIRKLEKTNLTYIEPHKVIIKGITFLVFNYSNDVYISNLSKKIKLSELEEYLKKSKNIALILFLIDIRHTPTANDKLMYDYIIKCGIPCLVIANKADKIAITKVDNQVDNLQSILNPLKDLTFLPYSSERRIYVDKVWENINNFLDI